MTVVVMVRGVVGMIVVWSGHATLLASCERKGAQIVDRRTLRSVQAADTRWRRIPSGEARKAQVRASTGAQRNFAHLPIARLVRLRVGTPDQPGPPFGLSSDESGEICRGARKLCVPKFGNTSSQCLMGRPSANCSVQRANDGPDVEDPVSHLGSIAPTAVRGRVCRFCYCAWGR